MGQKWVELAISKEATKDAEEEEENEDQQFVLLLPAQLVTTVASNQRGMTRVAGSFKRMSHTFTSHPLLEEKAPPRHRPNHFTLFHNCSTSRTQITTAQKGTRDGVSEKLGHTGSGRVLRDCSWAGRGILGAAACRAARAAAAICNSGRATLELLERAGREEEGEEDGE